MDIEAVRKNQVVYLEALYDNVSNGPNMQVMKLLSALSNIVQDVMLQRCC